MSLKKLILIAGPCVIESRDHVLRMADIVLEAAAAAGMRPIFKASFDKANRSTWNAYRGPGLERGLEILAEVKRILPIEVTTDIHVPDQADPVGQVVDIIQIPASLSRQTDLITAAAKTGRIVNIKKGQTMHPFEMAFALGKARSAGADPGRLMITERGTAFGYNDLVIDFRSIMRMRMMESSAVIVDVSHPTQYPGRKGGCPETIPLLARAAVAAGADGIFVEIHDDPARALSDGRNSLPAAMLLGLCRVLVRIREAIA